MVAMYLGLEPNEVIDGVVDDAEHLTLLDNLINTTLLKAIIFMYQEMPPYPLRKLFRHFDFWRVIANRFAP